MEDPQLAAMMVANAKKQALENTRRHWNRNHEHSVESTGRGEAPNHQRKQDPSAQHLATQASMLREAAASNQLEVRQGQHEALDYVYPMQRVDTRKASNVERYSPRRQQHLDIPQQQQQYEDASAFSDDSSDVFGGSDFSNFSAPSTSVQTFKASNTNQSQDRHQPYASSDVSAYYNSDFSIPSVNADSDVLIRHPEDYYASPRGRGNTRNADPDLSLDSLVHEASDDDDDGDSSSSGSGDYAQAAGMLMNMYPVSPMNKFGDNPRGPIVPMSSSLVLPTEDSESEDGMIFMDRSPAESPIPPPEAFQTTSFRDEPLQFIDSPSRRKADVEHGNSTITPTKSTAVVVPVSAAATAAATTTTTTSPYRNPTPTKTPKVINTKQSRNNYRSNIVHDEDSADETFDDDILQVDRRNVSLSSDPLNDISRFEDEPRNGRGRAVGEVREQEFPICAEFSGWTKRNRLILVILIGIFLLTATLIIIRAVTSDKEAIQDNPPNLADTIKLNRTDDDDDVTIVIVNNTQGGMGDDGPTTIPMTSEPTSEPNLPSPPTNAGSTTNRPTPLPTPPPTMRPTRPPTPLPTRLPTRRPSLIGPTPFPTIDPFGFNREQFLFQVATEASSASSLLDDTTAQYRAFQWMVNDDDPSILDPIANLGKGNDIAFYEKVIDRYNMALLYFSTGGPNWRNQYNLLAATSVCDWNDGGAGSATEGVTCSFNLDPKGYEIEEIVLDVNSLDGMIPGEIGQFKTLKKLTMGSNNLFGAIPTEMGTLLELTYLGLQRNFLIGSVPAQLGRLTKLTGLVLHNTGLNGRVPSTFSQLSNLSLLFLESTSLTGDLNPTFCGGQIYQMFYAGCRGNAAFVSCSCCTHCCFETGAG
ncbi:MAG: hypothetical protein SGBAC_013261, partial [Bacillariaceae sp.]